MSITSLLDKINQFILNPLILLLFVVAAIIFFWGIVELIQGSTSQEGREKGQRNIIYGLLGMLIMVGVYGIIRLILATFGLDDPTGGYLPL